MLDGGRWGYKASIACAALALVCSAVLAGIGLGVSWGLPWIVGAVLAQLLLITKGANRAFAGVCALGAAGAAFCLARFFEVVLSTAWPEAALLIWSAMGRVSVALGMTTAWILWALSTEFASAQPEETLTSHGS